ncbi:hypothetical protein JTB14_027066 [Gonioctena quinquepunctata]|nr:hypothetical protein JTB14_027066 [Gonioctena quinquepunctata]
MIPPLRGFEEKAPAIRPHRHTGTPNLASWKKYKNKKKTAKPPLKRKKKEVEESDSTSISDSVSEGDSDDEGNYDAVSSLQELVEAEKGVSDTESSDAIYMESWIIVTYSTKKTIKRFVGEVIEVLDDNIRVTFLKMEGGYFVWPDQDIDTINKDDVLQMLSSPKEGRRDISDLMNLSTQVSHSTETNDSTFEEEGRIDTETGVENISPVTDEVDANRDRNKEKKCSSRSRQPRLWLNDYKVNYVAESSNNIFSIAYTTEPFMNNLSRSIDNV